MIRTSSAHAEQTCTVIAGDKFHFIVEIRSIGQNLSSIKPLVDIVDSMTDNSCGYHAGDYAVMDEHGHYDGDYTVIDEHDQPAGEEDWKTLGGWHLRRCVSVRWYG